MWPDWVIAFVGDGRIALLALAVIGVEALLVLLFLRRRARIGSLILTMASGAGLLGALYMRIVLVHPNYHSGGAEIAGNWPPAWVAYLAATAQGRASPTFISSTP
jgi:hypothetical protein